MTKGNEIPSGALLAGARARMDTCAKRGQISRGAYIVATDGVTYLTKVGKWTHGVVDELNWWDSISDAMIFLSKEQEKANAPALASDS